MSILENVIEKYPEPILANDVPKYIVDGVNKLIASIILNGIGQDKQFISAEPRTMNGGLSIFIPFSIKEHKRLKESAITFEIKQLSRNRVQVNCQYSNVKWLTFHVIELWEQMLEHYGMSTERMKESLATNSSAAQAANQSTEPRRFYRKQFHTEWRIENSDAEPVAKYLFDALTRAGLISLTENEQIHFQSVDYCDPQKHGTLQYAVVLCGRIILSPSRQIGGGLVHTLKQYPFTDPPSELIYITVNQGGEKKSLVNFDTEYQEVFTPFSNIVLKELQKVFTVIPLGTKNSHTAQVGEVKPEKMKATNSGRRKLSEVDPAQFVYRLAKAQEGNEVYELHRGSNFTWRDACKKIAWKRGHDKSAIKLLENARLELKHLEKADPEGWLDKVKKFREKEKKEIK